MTGHFSFFFLVAIHQFGGGVGRSSRTTPSPCVAFANFGPLGFFLCASLGSDLMEQGLAAPSSYLGKGSGKQPQETQRPTPMFTICHPTMVSGYCSMSNYPFEDKSYCTYPWLGSPPICMSSLSANAGAEQELGEKETTLDACGFFPFEPYYIYRQDLKARPRTWTVSPLASDLWIKRASALSEEWLPLGGVWTDDV
ncbi:hypothetical protein M406DRAFT_75968 [Cryphonectria parasitica EP155]|uniref:Uncharacterized protein n=1 Tax=Cryphonectria parasitica (strain ATCC 38755 / EP155) TaxID=660469 RepID=A0A9P4XSW4_CRYP1|nr:uncharacterized protein M406DRAFT_75968 [Cryphonectria parasitica EP155]KAF3760306.1 hypothetical protein M406DRAFT_75968 [Cryphonectria parasitica EP155]